MSRQEPINDTLSRYLSRCGSLHRNVKGGIAAPHKPILLLALLAEVERGHIIDNRVFLTPELVARFRAYWRILVPDATWQERIVYPFRYLLQEGFWELVKDDQTLTSRAIGDPTSAKQLVGLVDHARFASDLWRLLQDNAALHTLRRHLLQVYFGVGEAQIAGLVPADPLFYEAEKLKAEAQSKFRTRQVKEPKTDGYFVRHALFPRVIKSLYGETCAVCRLTAAVPSQATVVDAVHIMPFGTFHNDDPRNGMVLCKNHHWAFDTGGITVEKDYTVRVSKRLTAPPAFVRPETLLLLPSDRTYAPAQEALAWHRDHRFLK